MIIRSRAPLRLGLAGGGTDVSPYSDNHGGAILNITIDKFAYATIKPLDNGKIRLISHDLNQSEEFDIMESIPINGHLDLLKGVYNRIVKDFVHKPLSFELTTFVDVPKGSGMGTSSTITVAILGAFIEWLNLPLGEYDIAKLAYEVERIDLNMSGGKQDQYAATFGGVNFMEFGEDKVIVNPLRIKPKIINELQHNLLLYYTGTSRYSSSIIDNQIKEFEKEDNTVIEAGHQLKKLAYEMKEALLTGNIDDIGSILHQGWLNKKLLTDKITNPIIDDMYKTAMENGALGGKISGAGGGGFFVFYTSGIENNKYQVIKAMEKFNGRFTSYNFSQSGMQSWSIR